MSSLAETPVEEARTLQEILIECTSFEHAGAVDKQGKEQLIAEVAESVESDADIPLAGTSQPAAPPTTAERITSGLPADLILEAHNKASCMHGYFTTNSLKPLPLTLF